MTFTAAAAAGQGSVQELRQHCAAMGADNDVRVIKHGDLAVAWAAGRRWVTAHDDGSVLVVVDGHLHNLFEVGTSPAALLHRRYAEQGDQLGEELFGDYVAVVLDRPRQVLVVIRDPLGVRPWYQSTNGRRHAGATDVATLCALPSVDDSVNERQAIAFLSGAAESRGETLHRGISTLAPGSTWRWTGGSGSTWKHHSWRLRPETRLSFEEAVERCRTVFDEAVRSRLRAAGAASSELSGGLDSSAVVGTIMDLAHPDLLVGRLVFEGPRADERNYSDAVLRHWSLSGLSSPPWVPTEEEAAALTAVLRRPPPDPNFLMFASLHRAFLYEGRHDGLTGLGGDDAFEDLGVERRIADAFRLRQVRELRGVAYDVARHPREQWRSTVRPTLRHVLRPSRSRKAVQGWIASSAPHRDWLVEQRNRSAPRVTGVESIDLRLDQMHSGYHASILEDAAVVADLVGRRNSHPFLDPRFIAVTYALNPWFPVRHGHRSLQRAVFFDRLPPLVRERRSKAEFSEVVLRRGLSDELLHRITTGPLVTNGWLDLDGFNYVLRDASLGQPYTSKPLSRALALDRWLRQG